MDSDNGPSRTWGRRRARRPVRLFLLTALWVAAVLLVANAGNGPDAPPGDTPPGGTPAVAREPGAAFFTPGIVLASLLLVGCSAFFSASEVAFFSLHKLRVRALRESGQFLPGLAARLLDHPGSLLTTILMGNSIVNVLLGIVIGTRFEDLFASYGVMPRPASYALAVLVSTAILVLFGEVIPKVVVVWRNEAFACTAAPALYVLSGVMTPLRRGMIRLTGFFFRITRFSQMAPAPFMTDDELRSVLTETEATGVIEREELRMIEGILEFSEMTVRELLIPRPDVVALQESATIREALATLREHEYARIPVYAEDLDHITGVLYMKDLLPAFREGALDQPVKPLLRKPLFVPETMTVSDFVKTAQRMHMHLAIVVDEYGGTEGIVALQDALRELVGEFGEEKLEREQLYERIGENVYRAEGNLPLDELEQLVGFAVDDEEHTTVAGFLMDRSEKILEVGDEIVHEGVRFTVEAMNRRRVSRLRIEVPERAGAEEQA